MNPVVAGLVRATQSRLRSLRTLAERQGRVFGCVIHGDASFAGLGAAYEGLVLATADGYETGGTVHLVLNNQVGFTTEPRSGRAGAHATDLARAVGAPVVHCCADDPEAVWRAMEMAVEYRQLYRRDVVVDLVGYRRHGHNELEDPSPGMPLTYAAVRQHPPAPDRYRERLLAENTVSAAEVARWDGAVEEHLARGWHDHEAGVFRDVGSTAWVRDTWQGEALAALEADDDRNKPLEEKTGLPLGTLQWVGRRLCALPHGFGAHPDVVALLDKRRNSLLDKNSRVDWATAEALALGTLALHQRAERDGAGAGGVGAPSRDGGYDPTTGLNRGAYSIRFSGQDVERGTFNQRHAAIYDQVTAARWVPLDTLSPFQEPVRFNNSVLNEAGSLAFEYGHSLGTARSGLTVWEAQFGDFANSAQVVIDQFITSGEEKWGQQSNIVVLLPHGYDGLGPDHSSARLERWLQAANDDLDALPGASPTALKTIAETFRRIAVRVDDEGAEASEADTRSEKRSEAGSDAGSGETKNEKGTSESGGRLVIPKAVFAELLEETSDSDDSTASPSSVAAPLRRAARDSRYGSADLSPLERADALWAELGLAPDDGLDEASPWVGTPVCPSISVLGPVQPAGDRGPPRPSVPPSLPPSTPSVRPPPPSDRPATARSWSRGSTATPSAPPTSPCSSPPPPPSSSTPCGARRTCPS